MNRALKAMVCTNDDNQRENINKTHENIKVISYDKINLCYYKSICIIVFIIQCRFDKIPIRAPFFSKHERGGTIKWLPHVNVCFCSLLPSFLPLPQHLTPVPSPFSVFSCPWSYLIHFHKFPPHLLLIPFRTPSPSCPYSE